MSLLKSMEKPRGKDRQYLLYHYPSIEPLALEIAKNSRIIKHLTIDWKRFPDNTPNIQIHGIDTKEIEDQDILFLADFYDYSTIMEQFAVLMVLCESFIHSLTILCPFFPTGTMERVSKEGEVATANTLAWQFNSLPRIANPTKVVIYDLHTLQNRFYFKGGALIKMASAVPIIVSKLKEVYPDGISIAFPDEGAFKRFNGFFKDFETIICGKRREGEERIVVIYDGDPKGKKVIIVDDLVQTGGTLHVCKNVLLAAGAVSVDAYVTHAIFPKDSWKDFLPGGKKEGFSSFWIGDTCPEMSNKLDGIEPFKKISIVENFFDFV